MNAELQPRIPSITTLERFIAPPGLNGSHGSNRLDRGRKSTEADNDVDAVIAWLSSLTDASDATISSYRSAAEKLLNWSCFSRGKALSSLDDADLQAFVEFLAAPRPALDWICKSGESRDSQDWRPFTGPLSMASVRLVVAAAAVLFKWMGVTGYASMPPIADSRLVRSGLATQGLAANISARGTPRTLSREAWTWVMEVLIAGVEPTSRLAIELMYFANLKVEEIRQLRLADCVAPSSDSVAWRLQLESMTNCLQCVYVLPPLGKSLSELFAAHSAQPSTTLSALEMRQGSELLFGGGGRDRIAGAVRSVLRRAADLAEADGDAQSAEELRGATLTYFRGALESHSGGDRAFILGFIANAKGCRSVTAEYFRRIVLDNEATAAGWARLAEHWQPYSERLALASKTTGTTG
ncbi:hypothetical protein [Roseateles sp.]|uniref:hypothetical protein n=1 Tax=Roseateles sp. TaxID=1971397 RepID=UPI0039E7DD69